MIIIIIGSENTFIKPDKEYEKYFSRLLKDRVVYTNDIQFTRKISRKHPELFDKDKGFLDIARIKKRNESVLILRPYAGLAPISPPSSINSKKKYQFFRIF